MMLCGEIGAEASVASTLAAIFDLARVDIDQVAATATTATIPPMMMILRIPLPPRLEGLRDALAHHRRCEREVPHTRRRLSRGAPARSRARGKRCISAPFPRNQRTTT